MVNLEAEAKYHETINAYGQRQDHDLAGLIHREVKETSSYDVVVSRT